jgi:hypothetical protein
MFLATVDSGIIGQEEAIELVDRAGEDYFQHFLFLCFYFFGIEEVDLHAGIIQTPASPLLRLLRLFIIRIQDF